MRLHFKQKVEKVLFSSFFSNLKRRIFFNTIGSNLCDEDSSFGDIKTKLFDKIVIELFKNTINIGSYKITEYEEGYLILLLLEQIKK